MRIAFVTTEYPTEDYFAGGLANYLYRVAGILKKMGHEPEIFVCSNQESNFFDNGVLVHRVFLKNDIETGEHQWIRSSELLNQKLVIENKIKPFDIVQYSNWMATGLKRIEDIPSVTRLSSFQPLWFKKQGDDTVGKITLSTPEEELELEALRKSDAIFSPSLFLADEVDAFVDKKIEVIETPFELEKIELDYSLYKKHLDGLKYLLFFGRISENKGCVEIAEIIYDLLKKHSELFFVLVGDNCPYGESNFVDFIKKNAAEFEERVIHLPAVRHNFLYLVIKNCYAAVLPSKVDNLPNTCLEAMSHEKIVVGPKDASFDQLIVDGINGFLFDRNKKGDLLEKIEALLLLDKSSKEKMEQKAHERIAELSPDKTVRRLLNFYANVIEKKAGVTINLNKKIVYLKKKVKKFFTQRNRLVMTLLVRDEVDIVEKNIKFHLSCGVDFIVATDNGSVDGTREILKKYEKAGKLYLIDEPESDYSQSEWVNRMGKIAVEKYDTSMVFHCDADEFWFSKSGNIKNELLKRKNVDCLRVGLRNVILERDRNDLSKITSYYEVLKPIKTDNLEVDSLSRNLYLFDYPPKVIYKTNKGYLDVVQGNHDLADKSNVAFGNSQDIIIHHFPLRSKEHFAGKVSNGGASYEKNKKLGEKVGWHWRRWYESYKKGVLEEEYKKLTISSDEAKKLIADGVIKPFNFSDIVGK